MSSDIPDQPPSRSLRGRVAIVTGAGCAGSGIGNGRAISILLADDGCNVVCLDMNLDWANKTVDMVNAKPGRGTAIAMQGDVTKQADCDAAVQLALDKFGRLDVLVNNVGVGGAPGTAVEVDLEKFAQSLEVNVSSMVRMAKAAIPAMVRDKDGVEIKGSIVNMGSVAGMLGGTPHLLYPTSKGAVVNMTRAMAAHHAKDGIRVNCVCPGMLYTPMMYAGGMSEEVREARKGRSLLGTEGSGWDAACAVVFLASDHSRWITGAILPVDAGTTAATSITLPKGASVNG
ncbi:short-chain dehydrogenase/reductase SDR [Pyricularia oryzae 70-15]|uniref:Short-chain dehydrogenase/reductase SDR n=1 Tax=Pyricularia oryzae (strain 70-15 / ATCC MYA-4617 / FGSC 8958) TaxID=242507 RepID=G4NES9_PYRO7|nr:short-chain dehydrogenase/reductase SDR [Pyricularia oryzae 70-15]EHA49502.1 short-chain dehydrogenase/reductase SDR [Pyricularia oryzae 70-15]